MRRNGAVAVLLVPVLALSACGSSKSDKDKITDLVKDVGKNPATLCTKYASSALLEQIGGIQACQKLAEKPSSRDPSVRIDSIVITKASATAKVTGNEGHQTIGLVKVGGSWRVGAVAGS